jgi:Leucine-rich repeat (LRR) protein
MADLSVLASLEVLQTLDLSNNDIADWTVLAPLPSLSTLTLSNCGIRDEDLAAIRDNLPYDLTVLYLADNQITDLMDLSTLDRLSVLDVTNNQIADITQLLLFSDLRIAYLEGNGVDCTADADALAELWTQLRTVDVCPGSAPSPLQLSTGG